MPLSPRRIVSQADTTLLPTGEMIPRPVMTTRRLLTRYLYEGLEWRGREGLESGAARRREAAKLGNQALVRRSLMYSMAW